MRFFLIAGLALVMFGLMLDTRRVGSLVRVPSSRPDNCQSEVNDGVVVSREQLAQFLTISERDSREKVQSVLQTPYCQLPALEVRAGVAAERFVYPLAFDPKTWLIVLYEGNEYAGYQFRVQR
jgi:hypothetical protein